MTSGVRTGVSHYRIITADHYLIIIWLPTEHHFPDGALSMERDQLQWLRFTTYQSNFKYIPNQIWFRELHLEFWFKTNCQILLVYLRKSEKFIWDSKEGWPGMKIERGLCILEIHDWQPVSNWIPVSSLFSTTFPTSVTYLAFWPILMFFFSLYAYFLIACCLLWPWSNSWLWRIFNPFICSLHYSTAANSGFTVVTNRDTFMMIVNFLLLQVQVVSNKLQLSAIPCTMEWRFGGQFEPPYRIQARYFSCYLRNII